MALIQDEISAAYSKQTELAQQCWDFGVEATQRMFEVQMEGVRELLELQGRHFGPEVGEAAGRELPFQWMSIFSKAAAGTAEATQICFKTAAAMQSEVAKLAEEFIPELNRGLLGGMERATRSALAVATKAEVPRKRAA
jgi:hypothetical protein